MKRMHDSNELLERRKESARTKHKVKTSSRNSSKVAIAETSKNTLRSKPATRQQEKTKQSHSCKQKKEEKRRRYASKSSKLQNKREQENLYVKDTRKNRRQPKAITIKHNDHIDEAYNCSIYQISKRNGNGHIGTHTKSKYAIKRKSKYLRLSLIHISEPTRPY